MGNLKADLPLQLMILNHKSAFFSNLVYSSNSYLTNMYCLLYSTDRHQKKTDIKLVFKESGPDAI